MKKYIVLLIILFFQLSVIGQEKEITIISWNIQDFGRTKNEQEIEAIANIVRDSDIIAIQEVVAGFGGAQAVAQLADELNRKGAKWDYVISNPTKSPKYVVERYAFIWKNKHIKIKNRGSLITELAPVVDREPFKMDFYFNDKKITILNYHSRPHNKNPEAEIKPILNYIVKNIKNPVLLAGDFNTKSDNEVFSDFKNSGFKTSLKNIKTTLKRKCKNDNYLNYAIDNIFLSKHFSKIEAKTIDFVKYCDNLENARKLSDHLPVYLRVGI